MEKAFTEVMSFLVLPPGGPLLFAIAGLLVMRRWRRPGIALTIAGIAVLWVASLGIVGNTLQRMLELPPLARGALANVQAIVVIGGGMRVDSPDYGEPIVLNESLSRVRYAARLGRESGIPVLVSGASADGKISEAEVMAHVMKTDFGVTPRWIERTSTSTAENAVHSYAILAPERATRIALVTTARHMPRAARAFRAAGFEVVPAATGYVVREPIRFSDFVPSIEALGETRAALHELLGAAWYALRH